MFSKFIDIDQTFQKSEKCPSIGRFVEARAW